jgi:hypothetical protein
MKHMINVDRVLTIHQDTVVRWHDSEIDQPYDSIYGIVCEQHSYNFRLWHQEDIARNPDATDQEIANVKRSIDKLNQRRNDWIEKIDQWIVEDLTQQGTDTPTDAPRNTETPGSAIDRLSILALRLYHLDEQTARLDATPDLIASVNRKIVVGLAQQKDLSKSLAELIADIYAGRKRHGTYQQMKMYNDPKLNPQIYNAQRRAG